MPVVAQPARGAAVNKQWKGSSLKDFSLAQDGSFHALFSTFFTIDHQGDMTIPGCFGEQRVIISGYGHASWNGGVNALPAGKGRIFESDKGAVVEGQFFLDTVSGKETYLTVKALEDLQEWSYSLPTVESELQTIDGHTVRVLKRITVNEVSPVLMAASIGTRTLDIKGCTNCGTPSACPTCPKTFKEIRESLERARMKRLLEDQQVDPREAAQLASEAKRLLKGTAGGSSYSGDLDLRREINSVLSGARLALGHADEVCMVHFKELSAGEVDPNVRDGADRAVIYLAKQLGIPVPKLVWVQQENAIDRALSREVGRFWKSHTLDSRAGGWAYRQGDTIYIHSHSSLWGILKTVAHEMRHLVQEHSTRDDDGEVDARAFADRFIQEILSTKALWVA